MRLGAATVAAGVLVVAACGGGAGRVQGHSTTTGATSATPPATGGPGVTIGIICTTPADASQTLVRAWTAGDANGAARCATPSAVSTLFARPGRGAGWSFQGCDGPDPGVPQCAFSYPGGRASFTLMGTEAQGWSVTSVAFAP
jgi:hypothetical protein